MVSVLNQSSPTGSGMRAASTVCVCSVIAYAVEAFWGVPQSETLTVCTLLAGAGNAAWKWLRS